MMVMSGGVIASVPAGPANSAAFSNGLSLMTFFSCG
jgi:hypothetical protein